ncbi:MAG: helix-turn-helix transcriptional regulator [Oscillospiraceae bacterium]
MILIYIGNRIKEIRHSQQLTQEDLANKSKLDRTYLAGVENGKRNISIINLEKILTALYTDFAEFFKNNEEEEK